MSRFLPIPGYWQFFRLAAFSLFFLGTGGGALLFDFLLLVDFVDRWTQWTVWTMWTLWTLWTQCVGVVNITNLLSGISWDGQTPGYCNRFFAAV